MDKNYAVQFGKHVAIFTLKNCLIKVGVASSLPDASPTAFTEWEKLKKALLYWATGNSGATYGGFLLYFVAKDVGGNEWSKLGSWAAPTTLGTMRTKIIDPIRVKPQPNGDYLIEELRIINFTAVVEES